LDPAGQNLMPYVNTALNMTPKAGFNTLMIKPAAIPAQDTSGAFRMSCLVSHMSNDDPIVYPGVTGAAHHHTFFGNVGVNAYSTNDSMRTSGNSTCSGGIANRSGYWMPSLIDTTDGRPVAPDVVLVYYKTDFHGKGATIVAPPKNLRMVAGQPKPKSLSATRASYFCEDTALITAENPWGTRTWGGDHLQACGGPSQYLRMIIEFPSCWDGKNLDSPDHISHMANFCGDNCEDATGKIGPSVNGCPASHPVHIPHITINADYYPGKLDKSRTYRLASDNYSTAYPGGYSLHADWMNGWDETIMNRMVKSCLNKNLNCGGTNLGDGEMLYGVNNE